MYAFEYQRAKSVADAAAALAKSGGKALAGGQSLVGAMKLRLANPGTVVDLGGIAELKGIKKEGDAIVIGAMTTHAEVAASAVGEAGDSRARGARRGHRRPPGAQSRNARRRAGQQRSGGGLSCRGARPGRDGADQQAQDRRRRFFQGHVRDRARRRRDHHGGQLSDPEEGGVHEVSAAGVALRAGRRVRRADRRRACASRSPAPASHVHRATAIEAALAKSFTADAAKAVKIPADHLNSDLHGSAEYRAHLVSVMAARAVAAAG